MGRCEMTQAQLFSLEDKSYEQFNTIGLRNKGLWIYTNEKAQGMFLKWKFIPKNNPEGKSVYSVSKINGEWCNKLGWKGNYPLYKLHELIKTTKPILIVEGETTVDFASKLFPNYFVTTWPSGASSWHKTNWSSLKGKEDVTFWPDNDDAGFRAVNSITRELSDKHDVQSKIVDVPMSLPPKWDLADLNDSDNINVDELVSNAQAIKKFSYEDIATDIQDKRWVFIKQSRKTYYDRFKKTFEHKETINDLYKRDLDLKGIATNKLHKEDIDVVDATAFWPTDKEYIFDGDKKYINTYRAPYFEPLDVKASADDVNVFREHLKLVCNQDEESFNWLEDTIAHDVQRPEINRLWAVLIQGDVGLGKSVIFEAITKLLGGENVEWVPSDAFATRFRDWLKKCCAIVCNEFSFEKYNKFSSNAYGMLNELITENKHFVESKGVDSYKHKGHYKIWLSSNDAVPIKLSPRDRRYFITKIYTTKAIILEKDPNYFKKLWAFVDDTENIKKLYWYYKATHKINDEVFDPFFPLMTQAKRILTTEGAPQVMRDLDVLFDNKEGPFEFDIVNSTAIINYVRLKEHGTEGVPNPRGLFNKLTQDVITEWISKHEGVPIKNGLPVNITTYEIENKKKARYHAIRNHGHWIDCVNLEELRAHMISKVSVGKKHEQSVF